MISQDIYDQVAPIAATQGVPDYVWMSIVLMESGGNPKAKNETDREASYGLFQLNTKGGQGTGYDPDSLYDPKLNASIAIPRLAKAYRSGVTNGISEGPDLAAYVAANSGHPGYGLSLDTPAVKKVSSLASGLFNTINFPGVDTNVIQNNIEKAKQNAADPNKKGVMESLGIMLNSILSKEFWVNTGRIVLFILVGVVLVILGFLLIFKG